MNPIAERLRRFHILFGNHLAIFWTSRLSFIPIPKFRRCMNIEQGGTILLFLMLKKILHNGPLNSLVDTTMDKTPLDRCMILQTVFFDTINFDDDDRYPIFLPSSPFTAFPSSSPFHAHVTTQVFGWRKFYWRLFVGITVVNTHRPLLVINITYYYLGG